MKSVAILLTAILLICGCGKSPDPVAAKRPERAVWKMPNIKVEKKTGTSGPVLTVKAMLMDLDGSQLDPALDRITIEISRDGAVVRKQVNIPSALRLTSTEWTVVEEIPMSHLQGKYDVRSSIELVTGDFKGSGGTSPQGEVEF